ncbi:hypothetical protein BpHYR1_049052 [Brachionus plicatilis]|uniref:Uncharacterized protein n=1 Tax=Brachionus plicatilis TaxID=10195 RepID=A0A3M7PQS7_BRAPC|nr:hypothetical protein BpHYR1_049052 [Brachionus plicatilis]
MEYRLVFILIFFAIINIVAFILIELANSCKTTIVVGFDHCQHLQSTAHPHKCPVPFRALAHSWLLSEMLVRH